MKKLLLLSFSFCSAVIGLSQQTITSIANGNASNIFIWDCACIPTFDDDIIINHKVNLDVDWAVNSGGSVTVGVNGELKQVGLRSVLVDGASSTFVNNGFTQINAVGVTNGAQIKNYNHFSITQGLYVGNGSTLINSNLMDGLDSLMTEGDANNSGTIYTGNFLNTGNFVSSGHIDCDSIGNSGTFQQTAGSIEGTAIGNSGTYTLNAGWMHARDNWANIENFTINANGTLYCDMNLYNGDTLNGGVANLTNNGAISVGQNFYNFLGLSGSGIICIADESYNSGTIVGTLDICDNTGNDFDYNFGSISGTITYCNSGCQVGVKETDTEASIYPNPARDIIQIQSKNNFNHFTILEATSRIVKQGVLEAGNISIADLTEGFYILVLNGIDSNSVIRFEKK